MFRNFNGKSVLVTGAGGWLGGAVAARLVQGGAGVTALLRRPGPVLGNDGLEVSVARSVIGDITAPLLGMDEAGWRAAARQHDLVVHCAALTRFDADPVLAHAVNVAGTAAVVDLVAEGGAGLIHVSTAYVNGTQDGLVSEDAPVGHDFNNVYEATKAAGEDVVRASGVPAAIVRPSIVLGESGTGRVRSFGTFYYLLKVLAEGRVRQMPAEPWATLDLVPIDHVVDGILAVAGSFDRAVGGTFHLTSARPTPLSAFAETLSAFPGLAIPEFVPPASFVPPPGRRFARLLEPYAPYFRRDPRFSDENLRGLTGRVADAFGAGWYASLVSFAIEAGFLCPAGRQASRTVPNGMARERLMPSSEGSR